MAQSVKAFVRDSYQLVSPNSPTVPLHGNDTEKGVQFLNELLAAYSGTGLMITVAKEILFTLPIGQQFVTLAAPDFIPTPDVPDGRLANLQNAWLELDSVTYPLMIENRNTFYASYKYQPQLGLPRFIIIQNQIDVTQVEFYPAASQEYNVHMYGKFQLPPLTENDTMALVPTYYIRYLRFGLAKELAFYKGRSEAWTPKLEQEYMTAKKDMESVSSVNLNIETEQESYLNGSWRVRAGV